MSAKIQAALGYLLGALFVYAGMTKTLDPARFFADIRNYDILPWPAVAVMLAFYLPWLEILCGVAVIIRPLRAGALLLLTTLLLAFTAALAQAWVRGLDISCGCFGKADDHPGGYLPWIGRDAGLLIVALWLTIAEARRERTR